ncbi:MAG: DUF4870 domain-containing protein [Leptolyngbya sp. PLA2]|nr:DUF4870 domain-containing protein [Leptolyngbya sp.]MCE7972600.1 DUF4870 domain-containing protein [Leptolyngbya sp. PL-A2]MCZ7634318.1 DUF4870 domain-containing protein [Phycisphaerales bacterium]MDL1904884.1 DUF4870 domain-containing protein [Synechococcales cyanobacterium CNB]GIK19630.1 MAG: hypothetical protein BroJett004_17940 [Planctomycetota bacterium]
MHAAAAMYETPADAQGPLIDAQAADWERTYCVFVHLSHLVMFFLGIPIVVPLILWLAKKDDSPLVDHHGREALNFEISLLIYAIPIGIVTCGVGAIFAVVLGFVGGVMAVVAASRGQYFCYPMCFRFIH